MKYIPDSRLEAISSWLQGRDGQSGVLFGQVLQYSTGINSPPSSPIPTSSFNNNNNNNNNNNTTTSNASNSINSTNSNSSSSSSSVFRKDNNNENSNDGNKEESNSMYIESHEEEFDSSSASSLSSSSINTRPRSKSLSITNPSNIRKYKMRSGSVGNRDSRDQNINEENNTISPTILQIFREALQMTFTDFHFNSELQSNNFNKSNFEFAIQDINHQLAEFTIAETGGNPDILRNLWESIRQGMDLNRCEVYVFVPPFYLTPLVENLLWSRNYFFLNTDTDKVCFLSCILRMRMRGKKNNPFNPNSDGSDASESDHDGSQLSDDQFNTTQDSNYTYSSSDDN